MDASVLIPTFQRHGLLAQCVASLAGQDAGCAFEVVVGFDGPDAEGAAIAERAWLGGGGTPGVLRIVQCEKRGYTHVRERLIQSARGTLMISLNDDVVAEPGFVSAHVRAHEERRKAGKGPMIVVGDSPFARRPALQPETLLDRLVRETSMVFFYDVMNTPEGRRDRERNWGFRHCFGLNFSVPIQCVREAGGVLSLDHTYGYDDIELAFRITQKFGSPVLYRPEAKVMHHHWYTPEAIVQREHALGVAAWRFARANPAFGMACFGRDVTTNEELEYSREFVARENRGAERARATFETLGSLPGSAVDGPHAREMLSLIAQQHLLLKRWTWRRGLLEAAGSAGAAKSSR